MGVFIGVGYGQVSFVYSTPGLSWKMIWTHGFEDGPGSADTTLAGQAWWNSFGGASHLHEASFMSSEWTVEQVNVTIGTSTGPVIGTFGTPVTGSAVSASLPPNSCILVNKNTARGGRRGRGRYFLPPAFVAEGNIGPSGTIAGTQLTAIQTRITTAYGLLSASNYPPYLLHDVSEVAPTPVLSWAVQSRVATQRTRLRK